MIEFKPGQPHAMTPEKKAVILESLDKDLMLKIAAHKARVHHDTVKNWLARGENDLKKNIDSEFVQFFFDVKERQANKISFLLEKIEKCTRNWQAIAWYLERCAREDFGADSEAIQNLVDLYKTLLEDYKKLSAQKNLSRTAVNGEINEQKAQSNP